MSEHWDYVAELRRKNHDLHQRAQSAEKRVAVLESAIRTYLEDLILDPLLARTDDLRAVLQSGEGT